MEKRRTTVLRIVALIAFLSVIIVNTLTVLLPLNGLSPSEVSASYPNLITPAGLTFSIWGLIYLLLVCTPRFSSFRIKPRMC